MARHDIDKAGVRNKLEPRKEPHWGPPVERGLFVGFRRLEQGGNWIARYRNDEDKQVYKSLGPVTPAYDFEAAKRDARRWSRSVDAGVQTDVVLTVADVCRDYVKEMDRSDESRVGKGSVS